MSEYEVQVGQIRDRTYFLLVSAEPSLNDVQSFAVVLYYRESESNGTVQVARIDTSHGYTHIDKLYAERQETERLDVDVWEAYDHLHTNWKRFARLHRRHHEEH